MASLHHANNIQEIICAVCKIFQHLDVNKGTQPLDTIGTLARATERDVGDLLRAVISKNVMVMRCNEFEQRTNNRLFRDCNNKHAKLRSDPRQRKSL